MSLILFLVHIKIDSKPTPKYYIEKIVTQDTGPDYKTYQFVSKVPKDEKKNEEKDCK